MVLLLYGKMGDSSSSSGMGGVVSRERVAATNEGSELDANSSSSSGKVGDFGDVLVRLVYNEQVVRIPGCAAVDPNGFDCTLKDFLDYVVGDKTAADRFKKYCYGAVGTVSAGVSERSTSSSSSSSTSGKRSRVSNGKVGSRVSSADPSAVASVVTADGLQLVLGTRQQQQQQQQQQHLWAEE
jgi:hypothetical protein